MKKPKTNIYINYFRSPNTILTQSQKRRVIAFMSFAGLFVLDTIGGFTVTFIYALIGMFSLCVIAGLFLTEGWSTEEEPFNEEDEITNRTLY